MKKYRGILLLLMDSVGVLFSLSFAVFIMFNFNFDMDYIIRNSSSISVILLVYLIMFVLFKTNRSVWDRISVEEGLRIFVANLVSTFLLLFLKLTGVIADFSGSILIIIFLVNTLLMEIVRFSYRVFRILRIRRSKMNNKGNKRVLIYGAGNSGSLITNEIINSSDYHYYVVGFIDDNPSLKGKHVAGHVVFGGNDVLTKVINQHAIDEIIVAMPSESLEAQKKVLSIVYSTGLPTKSVTSSEVLFSNEPLKNSLKEVDIVDLLERKEILLDNDDIQKSIRNQNILVTGAAGSIGSELVRQIMKYNPSEITLFDINENGLYSLQQELLRKTKEGIIDSKIIVNCIIGSIRDYLTLDLLFSQYNFNLVFHTAAHKHVPLMETAPQEAIKNNIFGTRNLIDCCNKYNVDRFVNISTDKAVNPTNVMGATKRFNEMMLQSQKNTHTKFVAVRFGNVLGSNGSVVPLFKKQIRNGGPVTVTDPEITRYFMTIPEAVSLVLQAETFAKGGEIFVLDMGEPVKILDMAVKIIELSGYKPYEDIQIEFSGLRPGEKLYEELLMAEEGLVETKNNLIFVAHPIIHDEKTLLQDLNDLKFMIDEGEDVIEIVKRLQLAVPTFKKEEK